MSSSSPPSNPPDISLAALASALSDLDSTSDTPDTPIPSAKPRRPLRIYTRTELVRLSKSTLVCPPAGLPHFRDWFGEWDSQSVARKDADSHQRERRFKRDADDPEGAARPSFRSATNATQPSQMGNFKHHSSRMASVSERPEGDKDGHEKLRNLSERFDRERLALAGTAPFRREREKDIQASNGLTSSSGKGERKDKDTERNKADGDDKWRSGPEWRSKAGDRRGEKQREGRPDHSRDDTGDHRGRRESSVEDSLTANGRRRNASRDSFNRGHSRDGRFLPPDVLAPPHNTEARDDDRRKDIGETRVRRNNDQDKPRRVREDDENDDGRRWKEDNRWEDKKPQRDRDRQRGTERDGDSGKKGGARNKRTSQAEDAEKEPAWMEEYDPETDGKLPGILGGQNADGKLDDIQAWKKELKEKEQREKERTTATTNEAAPPAAPTPPSASQLDEISMFKMMIQQSQGKPGDFPAAQSNLAPEVGAALTQHPTQNASGGAVIDLSDNLGFLDTRNRPSSRIKSPPTNLMMHGEAAPKMQDYDPPRQSRFLSYGLPHTQANPPGQLPLHDELRSGSPVVQAGGPVPQHYRQGRDIERSMIPDQHLGISPHRQSPTIDYSPTSYSHSPYAPNEQFRDPLIEQRHSPMSNDGSAASVARGSRFAKFFDKPRDGPGQLPMQQNFPPSMTHLESFPSNAARYNQGEVSRFAPNPQGQAQPPELENLLTMLHNSSRVRPPADIASLLSRVDLQHIQSIMPHDGLSRGAPAGLGGHVEHGMGGPPLRDSPHQQLLSQHVTRNHQGMAGPMMDQLDSRFAMEGLAGGPRHARSRASTMETGYPNEFVDMIQYNMGRIPPEQARAFRTVSPDTQRINPQYNNYPSNSIVNHQLANAPAPRGLPPGLANLGARPPPDISHLNPNVGHIANNNLLQSIPGGEALLGPRFLAQQQQQQQQQLQQQQRANISFQQAPFNPNGQAVSEFASYGGRAGQAPSPVSSGSFRGQNTQLLNQQMMGRVPQLTLQQQQQLLGAPRNLAGVHPQMVGQVPSQYAGLEGSSGQDLMALLLNGGHGGSRMHQ